MTIAMSKLVRRILFVSLSICLAASVAFAEHTRRWRQSSYEEFLKGNAKGVAVRSDGHLELAPKFTLIADADASYLWSLRTDATGVLYAAGGSPAKVFRFEGSGKPKTAFESTDLLAQAIAFDAKGALYVATSPDGKVYRVSATGEKTVFFEARTKYIWDLAFAPDGTLYVATGDKGQIFAVAPDGKGGLFYASDEAHIKTLAFDAKGNLLAGTEPNGRVLRVTRNAEKNAKGKSADEAVADGFVVYETAKREVTSLTVAQDGTIYVAAIGEKTRTAGNAPSAVITTSQGTTTITNVSPSTQMQGTPFVAFPQAISSSIYRISTEGVPEEIWSSRDDVVYALGLNADGRLLAGTGNTGSLLVIDGHGVYAQLAKSGSAQITGISKGANGKVFLCTANPGKVFSLGPEYEAEGTFESQSFDAKLFSQWGRIEWWGPPAGKRAEQGNVEGAAAGVLCSQRKHRRSGKGMVKVVWTVHDDGFAGGSAVGAIFPVEGRDSRRAAGRWDRLGQRGVFAEECRASNRWHCHARRRSTRAGAAGNWRSTRKRGVETAASADAERSGDHDRSLGEI